MITKEELQYFCKKHNIILKKYDLDSNTIIFNPEDVPEIKKLYKKRYEKPFLYVNFKEKEYHETNYLYEKFIDSYNVFNKDDTSYSYSFNSYGGVFVPSPLELYSIHEYNKLFNNNFNSCISMVQIPVNTINQIEEAYNLWFINYNQIKDFYNSDTFNKLYNSYEENCNKINELKQINNSIKDKTFAIIQKKADIEKDFK